MKLGDVTQSLSSEEAGRFGGGVCGGQKDFLQSLLTPAPSSSRRGPHILGLAGRRYHHFVVYCARHA